MKLWAISREGGCAFFMISCLPECGKPIATPPPGKFLCLRPKEYRSTKRDAQKNYQGEGHRWSENRVFFPQNKTASIPAHDYLL
jgi:hypothetical protein